MRTVQHKLTRQFTRQLRASAATAAAIMALAIGGPALAQGVNGTGTIASGTGSITTSPGVTRVTTTSGQTIVNWRPTDTAPSGGTINFLPSGNTLAFQGNGNYIVLNRFAGIDPFTGLPIPITRTIGLAGNINSIDAATGQRGGNIWFYNAGGFLISNGGAINVGSLVLSASDFDTTGGLLGPGGTIRFRGTSGSTAAVQIDAGASITTGNAATPGSSYMAIVAPRVIQRGFVDVDGSVAYVAAEQADITINNGLFDINVLVGAEGGTVIDHSGTTTGTAQRDGDGRDSRIYMVAMPKNDAVTMLVTGQVGYRDPITAQIEPNGQIRLAAGYNIFQGEITQQPGSAAAANMVVRDIIFNSDLIARASNNLTASPLGSIPSGFPAFVPPPQQGILRFNQNALLIGDNSASITVRNQQGIIAARNLSVVAGGRGGTPGLAEVNLIYDAALPGNRPLMTVGGTLLIDAARVADPFAGSDSTGGTARLSVNGGLLGAGAIQLQASGVAGFGTATQGGIARGGTAEVLISGTGALVQTNFLNLSAAAIGGGVRFNPNLGIFEFANVGGAATGGSAIISVSNGAELRATQGILLDAAGDGGAGSLVGGTGTGGTARLSISGATSRVTSSLTALNANGKGGEFILTGPSSFSTLERGGDAVGGTSEIISNGQADLGQTFLNAGAIGGSANFGANIGGNARGGSANILVSGGALSLTGLDIFAAGIAGSGADGPVGTDDVSGEGIGGNIAVRASAGSITVNGAASADASGNASPGQADVGLARQGGTVEFRSENGGLIDVTGRLTANVSAGFDSSRASTNRSSGNAQGGRIELVAFNGTTRFGSVDLKADGLTADASQQTGSATGGVITLQAADNGTLALTNANIASEMSAIGFAGSGVVGGQGRGGTIQILAGNGGTSGTLRMAGQTLLNAGGTSGNSSSATTANPGQGGLIALISSGATSLLQFALLTGLADGRVGQLVEGGSLFGGNNGGPGVGGEIGFSIGQGGSVIGGSLNMSASGTGGRGTSNGGAGRGGNIQIDLAGGTLALGSLTAAADGTGGTGSITSPSGDGFGGLVQFAVNGTNATIGTMNLSANGVGGLGSLGSFNAATGLTVDGGNGGNGFGGRVSFGINTGILNSNQIIVQADGIGGDGGGFDAFSGNFGNTGNGGNGTGGVVDAGLNGGTMQADSLALLTRGIGGNGGFLLFSPGPPPAGSSVGGNGGNGTGGSSSLFLGGPTGNSGAIEIDASAEGGNGSNGFDAASGNGGTAQGGLAQLIHTAGNETLTGLSLIAAAAGGRGGSTISAAIGATGPGGPGGTGGSARGGMARIGANGAGNNLTLIDAAMFVDGIGGAGGSGAGAGSTGANGGNGIGGDIVFDAFDRAQITINAATGLSANGIGGAGGTGSRGADGSEEPGPAASGGNGTDATNPGQDGGNGQAGANGRSGGNGAEGGTGGRGGDGQGGAITLSASQNGTIINNVTSFTVAGIGGVGGTGGNGGNGGNGQTGGNGGNGGAGGPASPATTAGRGGNGGSGGRGGNGGFGGQGGMGGDGGRGFGGAVLFYAENGTITSGNININASGVGGANGDFGTGGRGGIGGAGGDAGLGGLSSFLAGSPGTGGAAGTDGSDGDDGPFNTNISDGAGGTIIFRTRGANDRITAGNVTLSSSGESSNGSSNGAAGSILFDVRSTGGVNPIELANLTINAIGSFVNPGNQAVNLDAGSRTIAITGALTINTTESVRIAASNGGRITAGMNSSITSGGDTRFDMSGSGQLAIDGTLTVTADRDIVINNPAGGSSTIESTGAASFTAGRDIVTGGAGVISALGGDLDLTAGGLISLVAANAGNNLNINAGTVDIGFGTAGSTISITSTLGTRVSGGLTAGEDIRVTSGDRIDIFSAAAGDDITLNGGGMLLGDLRALGTGADGEGDGADFLITSTGDVTIDHAEADSDFIANATGNFTTGLNSIITGGNIDITTGGDAQLGNSTAGGFITVNAGGLIGFNALDSGLFTLLNAGTSITGVAATSAQSLVARAGTSLSIGTITAGDDVILDAATGNAALGTINTAGSVFLRGGGAVTSATSITAGGDVSVDGAGSVTLGTTTANGTFVNGQGQQTEGNVFVIADGGASLGQTSARTSIGVRATSVTGTGTWTAGEDIFVDAVGAANLASLSAGDNVTVTAGGNITAANVTARGTARDDREVQFIPAGSVPRFLTLASAPADGSDITLRSTGGTVSTGALAAAGDTQLAAAGTISTAAINAGGRVDAFTPGSIRTGAIVAGLDVSLSGNGNIDTATVNAAGSIFARVGNGGAGTMAGLSAGTDIIIQGGVGSAITVTGPVTAGSFIEVMGGSLNFGNVTAGTDVILTAETGPLIAGNVTAGDDIWLSIFSSNPFALTVGNVRSTGLGSDTALSGPATFGDAGPAGNVIRIRSSGTISAGTISSPDRIIVVSDQASVTTGSLTAPGGIAALARTGITLGDVTTSGHFMIRNSNQFPLLPGPYQPSALTGSVPGTQTAVLGPVSLGVVSAGTLASIHADGRISYGSITASGTINLQTAFANLGNHISGGALNAGQQLLISGSGDAIFTNATAGSSANISVSGLVSGSALTAPAFSITGANGVQLSRIRGGGTSTSAPSTLLSANGAIRVDDIQSGAPLSADGRSVFLRGTGPLTLANIRARAGDIDVASTAALTVQTANASGALTLASGGAATIDGTATGTTITLASPDIIITTNGRLGTLGTTQSVTLTNSNRAAAAFIGGTGTRGGWHLDSAEITRLFGTNITIDAGRATAPGASSFGSASAPDVVIDDFTVNAAQQFGTGGTFAITTTGKMRVIGDARFTDMADGQSVRLRADDALEVILGEGSVVLNGAGSALGGRLRLQSADVIVATRAAIADVAAATTLGAINDRLALNDGITSDLGALVAKGMDISVNGGFYVQNSGLAGIPRRDFANRRGLTFGALGLNIQLGGPSGNSAGRIVINGQQIGGTGPVAGPVTGLDVIPLISINGVANAQTGFDTGSTVNGCLIVAVLACRANPDSFPVQDSINQTSEPAVNGQLGNALNPIALITLRGVDAINGEPLIDDPVTGAGNEDLWLLEEEEETR